MWSFKKYVTLKLAYFDPCHTLTFFLQDHSLKVDKLWNDTDFFINMAPKAFIISKEVDKVRNCILVLSCIHRYTSIDKPCRRKMANIML